VGRRRYKIKMTEVDKLFYKVEREKIWLAQDKRCKYCNKVLKKTEATIDHVVPLSQLNRHHSFKNCVVACDKCNANKGSEEWTAPVLEEWELQIRNWSSKIDERLKRFEYDLIAVNINDTKGGYTKWKRYWDKRNKWN